MNSALHKLKQSKFMIVAAESSNSLHIECAFNKPVFNKIFYVGPSSRINYPLAAKYAIGKLIVKKTIFKF